MLCKWLAKPVAPKLLANSIPKSGTHLLERLLYLLPGISRQFSGTLWKQYNAKLLTRKCASLKNGQFFVAHLYYQEDFPKILESFGIKTILQIRDPRDIVISNVNYMTYANKKHRLHDYFANHLKTDKERLHCCIKGIRDPEEYSIGSLLERFYPWMQCKNVLTVRFKDLIGEQGGGTVEKQKETVDGILNFMGIDLDEAKRNHLMAKLFYTRSKTFNKAQINQWETKYDAEDKKLFKEVAGDWLIKYGYEKDFDW